MLRFRQIWLDHATSLHHAVNELNGVAAEDVVYKTLSNWKMLMTPLISKREQLPNEIKLIESIHQLVISPSFRVPLGFGISALCDVVVATHKVASTDSASIGTKTRSNRSLYPTPLLIDAVRILGMIVEFADDVWWW